MWIILREGVDLKIDGDVAIPAPNSLTITTETDSINQRPTIQTLVRFAKSKGMRVDGELTSKPAKSAGVVDWYCYEAAEHGAWTGIKITKDAYLTFQESTVRHAKTGLWLDTADAYIFGSTADSCMDYGIFVRNCSPSAVTSSVAYTGRPSTSSRIKPVGAATGVRITGTDSKPTFTTGCWIGHTQKDSLNNGGNGVEMDNSGEAHFFGATVHDNENFGFYIHDSNGPYIDSSLIRDCDSIGIVVHRGRHYTTLRHSTVTGNAMFNIFLNSDSDFLRSKIRGWYHSDTTYTHSDFIWVTDTAGRNCIGNSNVNIYGRDTALIELGRPEYWPNGTVTYLGAENQIGPYGTSQGDFNSGTEAFLARNFWDPNDYTTDDGTATVVKSDPAADTLLLCWEAKRSALSPAHRLIALRRQRPSGPSVERNDPARTVSKPERGTAVLHEAHPNPFSGATQLRYTLQSESMVRLVVYDVLGREVAVLVDGMRGSGTHTAVFRPSTRARSLYYAVLTTEGGRVTRALVGE